MNTDAFLAQPKQYFLDSYDEFKKFGGPCVYFHHECIRAGQEEFLSKRHVEMLYATLTAWGLHRMGDAEKTKAKLMEWKEFHESFFSHRDTLRHFLGYKMLESPEMEYSRALLQLRETYDSLKLSRSNASVVVNSKALFHLFPEWIPPIDRRYTLRFFKCPPEEWLDKKGKFRQIKFSSEKGAQFEKFHVTCSSFKRLADQIQPQLFEEQRIQHGVTAPKALDNAIVNYVRIISTELRNEKAKTVSDPMVTDR